MKIIRFVLLSTFIAFRIGSANDITAFPGAEGAGALTTGGRGGAVLLVTNLELYFNEFAR